MDKEQWERLQDLFHRASELDAGERNAFLAEACGDDDALRREVESLLAASAGGVEKRLRGAISSLYATASPRTLEDPARQRIGPYKVLRELGQGGMSTVFLAERDDPHYRMRVAIKLVKRGMETEEILRRFRQERHILASLEHAHICKLLDGGTTDDGLPYFVMEHIDGEPIDVYCERHQLSIEDRLHLFLQVCSAVQVAHQNLVIHRDLKPSNLLVTHEGLPKLLDFGIAKLLDPDQAGHSLARTSTGLRLLTPEYASPEQVRGLPLSTATDIYSLGVLLYRLLTGQAPYPLKTRQLRDIEQAICETEPEKPSSAILRRGEAPRTVPATRLGVQQLRRRLIGDLDTIMLMALKKDPQRRYASVEQLAEDVERYLKGLPVRARQDTFAYRAGKFVQRHKTGVAATVLIFLSLVGGMVATAWQARIASRNLARAEAQQARAESTIAFLMDIFRDADPEATRGQEVSAREILDAAARRIESRLQEQPEVRAALFDTIGQIYTHVGRFERAEALLKRGLELRQELQDDLSPEVADSLTHLADSLLARRDLEAAEPLLQRALEARRAMFGKAHPKVVESLSLLGLCWYYRGDLARAEPFYLEAQAMVEKLAIEDHLEALELATNLGVLRLEQRRLQEAEALLGQALSRQRDLLGMDHPLTVTTRLNLVTLLYSQGRYQPAESLVREALDDQRRLLDADHLDIANSQNSLAALLFEQGELDEARPLYESALAIQSRRLGETHPQLAATLNNLADVLFERRQLDDAEAMYRRAWDLRRTSYGEDDPRTLRLAGKRARVLEARGDLEAAAGLYRDLLQKFRAKARDGQQDRRLPATLTGLGIVTLRQGRSEEAEKLLREAAELMASTEPSWQGAVIQGALAVCLNEGRELEGAELLTVSLDFFAAPSGRGGGNVRRARRRLIDLYDALGRQDVAARYRATVKVDV